MQFYFSIPIYAVLINKTTDVLNEPPLKVFALMIGVEVVQVSRRRSGTDVMDGREKSVAPSPVKHLAARSIQHGADHPSALQLKHGLLASLGEGAEETSLSRVVSQQHSLLHLPFESVTKGQPEVINFN